MITKEVEGPKVRGFSGQEWTASEYGEHLFMLGGHMLGSQTGMFKLAVAAACVDVLQQDVSKTPCYLKRRTKRGADVLHPGDHPAVDLLNSGPNDLLSFVDFLKLAVNNLALDSEYFIASRRRNNQELMEFAGIPKRNVGDINVNAESRKIFYGISPDTNFDEALFGWARGLQSSVDVAHIKRRSFNGVNVLSTAKIAQETIKVLSSMQSEQLDFFGNGGLPQLAFTFPDGLTDEQFDRLKAGFEKAVTEAKNRRKPLILEGWQGQTPGVETLSATAADQEFVKNNIAAAMNIIRYFRVPPHKVFLLESVKYDNMDPAERVYVDDTLCSYYVDIEQGLNHALLTKKERKDLFFEFDREAAYAMAPLDRQKIAESRWTKGMITKNEMRRAAGMNELGPAGDIYMMSGNFVLTDKNNEVLMRAGGNAPDAEKPEKEQDDAENKAKIISLATQRN